MRKTICLVPSVLNEAGALDKFLKYHSWVDEIIILDSGSTDATEEVCSRYGRRIIKRPVNGNYNQRSAFAVTQTKADWVFFADPDEFITNDPGTKHGELYRYDSTLLFNAIRNYPTGYQESFNTIKKDIIIIWK